MSTPLTTDDIKTLDQLVAAGVITGANRIAIEQTLGGEFVTATFTQILAYIQANISAGGETVSTEAGDKVIADGSDNLLIYLAGAVVANSTFSLPVAANNDEREITFYLDDATYQLSADVTGGGTMNGLSLIKMGFQHNHIKFKSNGTEWKVLSTEGFELEDYNGVLTPVFEKIIANTSPAIITTWTSYAHGIASGESKILGVEYQQVRASGYAWPPGVSGTNRWQLRYDDTNFDIYSYGETNQPFKAIFSFIL